MHRTPLIIYALFALLGAYLLYYGFTFHTGDAMFGAIHVRAAYCIPGVILVVVATTKLLRG